jgi:cell division protein FtsB
MPPAVRRLLVTSAFLVATFALGLAVDPRGLRLYLALASDLTRLETENARTRGEIEQLRRQALALSRDDATLERAAREEFNYVLPDEILFKLE